MKQIVAEKEAVQIGNRAFTALLEEVYASPKPGLVDLYSNGAHQDMNVRTFERSAAILRPFFVEMALQGLEHYVFMRKKIFASFMAALITAISLSGCSRAENSQEMAKSNAGESEIETDSGEVDEIVFAYFTQNNIPETSELQRIEDLLNEYTVEKINTKVHLALFSNADYMSQVNLMLASGEQLDIFRAYDVPQLTYIKDGTALDITEYIDNELKETRDVLYKDFLKQSTVDGKVYGIMNMGSQYVPGGFTYRTDIAQELGLDMDSVSSIEDLPAIFEQVKAAYPNMTILNHGSGGMFNEIFFSRSGIFDPLGDGNIKESVSGTAYQDDATIVNLYETPEYKTYANMMKEWSEKGYWASDAATTTATEAELYMSGNCFGGFTGLGNPKHSANMSANYGYPFETVQISDTMQWSVNNGTWMVNAASKAPSAACKFLNLLYTDKYVDNLLIYGEEGVDYQLNEDGFAVPPEGFESLNDVAYTNNQKSRRFCRLFCDGILPIWQHRCSTCRFLFAQVCHLRKVL